MIPKVIHYCWFGRNPLPAEAKKCIKSWKKYCKDYKIIQWDEDNYDLSTAPLYVRQAYEAKKWAFVTDYVRLHIVHEHGGIYMDTDVELISAPDHLLDHAAFFGFEDGLHIATGLGFGAEKGCSILYEMMRDYDDIPFIKEDGSFDITPCPMRNTQILLRHGLKQDDSMQTIQGCLILPSRYLCPLDYSTGLLNKTPDTISIHWFSASWLTKEQRRQHKAQARRLRRADWRHAPNRFLIKLLGAERYDDLKKILRH